LLLVLASALILPNGLGNRTHRVFPKGFNVKAVESMVLLGGLHVAYGMRSLHPGEVMRAGTGVMLTTVVFQSALLGLLTRHPALEFMERRR
jgi:hypothetical protein